MTVKVSLDMGSKWGLILLDGKPVAAASYDGAFHVNHLVAYVEREHPLSPDVFERMSRITADSEVELLTAFKQAIERSDIGMGNYGDEALEVVA